MRESIFAYHIKSDWDALDYPALLKDLLEEYGHLERKELISKAMRFSRGRLNPKILLDEYDKQGGKNDALGEASLRGLYREACR